MNRNLALKGVVAIVVLVFAIGAVVYSNQLSSTLAIGDPAPDFTLANLEGQEVSLSDLRGKVVVINFWTTWCTECTKEMPDLERFWEEHQDEAVILGINVEELDSQIEEYVADYGLTFPILKDKKGNVSELYRVRGYPETFVVSPSGTLARKIIGPTNETELLSIVSSLSK